LISDSGAGTSTDSGGPRVGVGPDTATSSGAGTGIAPLPRSEVAPGTHNTLPPTGGC